MDVRTEKIREIAKKLLAEGKVDVVIGYKKGTIPMQSRPYFARTREECDNLAWTSHGRMNLANFIPRRSDRMGVTAKGCDARNIVGHILENQVARDRVHIIGVPCTGMVDPKKIAAIEPREIREDEEKDGKIIVRGKDFETAIEKDKVLRRNCAGCIHRNPPVYDDLVCEKVPEQDLDPYADLKELLKKSDTERYAYYQDLVKDCVRCYACRDACPLCYCPVCFVDETMPQWVGKSQDPADVMTYHLLRAFHCAGRCTDCGACESACPVSIKVREFTRLLEKDVKELYGYEPGMSLEKKPPLTVYRPDDPQEFIK
jgi:ferredoxin